MNHIDIQVKKVQTREELADFIQLPYQIYRNDPKWPGQDNLMEMNRFLPEHNPGLQVMKVQPFIAVKNGEVVGRICGTIFDPFNQRWQKRVAFFGYFESVYNQNVADRLFEAVREWAVQNGIDELWGPINFNIEGEVGILIEGHHLVPTTGLAYNLDYYQDLCKGYGFVKEKDILDLHCTVDDLIEYTKLTFKDCKHLLDDSDYQIRSIDPRFFREDLRKIASVYNQSFYDHWGFGEISEDYFCTLMEETFHLLPSELFLIAEYKGKPVGFCFCSIDEYDIKKIRANTMGVIPKFRHHKIATWFYYVWAIKMKELGYQKISVSWAVEDSLTLRILRIINPKIAQKFRVFRKELKIV